MPRDRIYWRWDQGHQEYLQFANLKAQARVFSAHDGLDMKRSDETLRQPLMQGTGLDFKAPSATHSIWRQYARAFHVGLLVQVTNGALQPTGVCRLLAADADPGLVADDYLLLFAKRFRLPFPGFQDYKETAEELFPAAAVVKLLLAKSMNGNHTFSLSAVSALRYIEGNRLSGREALEEMAGLEEVGVEDASEDERRQVREMLAFLSQISWLHWEGSQLKLAGPVIENFASRYAQDLTPDVDVSRVPRAEAFSMLASVEGHAGTALSPDEDSDHVRYFEGNRRAVTHLRIERSRRLRELVIHRLPAPALCDACRMDPTRLYEWDPTFFDIHHVLPLASPVTRTSKGTSLDDVVPICPNCHRAVHAFYGLYLRQRNLSDFESRDHAQVVYSEVRDMIRSAA